MSLFIICIRLEKISVMFIWGVEVTDGNYEKAKTFSLMFYDTTTIFTFEEFGFNRNDRCIKN